MSVYGYASVKAGAFGDRGVGASGTRVTGSCVLSDMNVRNLTWVLCKRSTCY